MTKYRRYKQAFKIACELLNGDCLYGYDKDRIFEDIMKEHGVVSSLDYQKYILDKLDYLSGREIEWY